MIKTIFYVGIGGAIGSILRYLTAVFIGRFTHGAFPMATFAANMIGCFLMGILFGWLEKNNALDSPLKWLLMTGFCGGYTTFSAFGLENIQLWQQQHAFWMITYTSMSVLLGFLCVWLGMWLMK